VSYIDEKAMSIESEEKFMRKNSTFGCGTLLLALLLIAIGTSNLFAGSIGVLLLIASIVDLFAVFAGYDKNKVYVSISGFVYHSNKYCYGLTLPIEITEDEAISKGYKRCSRCRW